MNAAMVHRGPDDGGARLSERLGMAIGARRLSIIDVAGGHQPIANEDGTIWAVLNGEIYNHPALQAMLRRRGHTLRTRSDTEVLVHLYEEYGDDLVHALEGMFAFAVLDERNGRLVVGRDRFGEKPLFYTVRDGGLVFASELDALLVGSGLDLRLDPIAVDEFFVMGYVGTPRSIARDVEQLPAGHLLSWQAGEQTPVLRRYWAPPAPREWPRRELEGDLVAETLRLLEASVRGRMLADVPLGVLLSGGLDSTLLAAIAARLADGQVKTFTVGYDTGTESELEAARVTAKALGSEHRELLLTADALAARVPKLLAAIDQPVADPALVALNAVAEFARQEVTVAVGGEGADELFGGYPRYHWLARAQMLDGRAPPALRRAAVRGLSPLAKGRARRLMDVVAPLSVAERHLAWVTGGRRQVRETLYGPALQDVDRDALARSVGAAADAGSSDSLAAAFMRLDQRSWLQDDVLPKADRAGMLVSLELRTPYLHRELAEFAATVPPEVHVGGGGKRLLRRALEEVGPKLPQRRKRAFGVPLAQWLRGPLRPLLEAHVSDSSVYSEGLFDPRDARLRVRRHVSGAGDETAVLWPLLTLGLWLDGRRAA
ncbi:MAG: asparagine synthase (glutamine-hydrolyzing) [Actinomycetota bacterium]|nr:asparagine synthase (glutamine-hydrolyzing) [Actinomycetota bacterium]